MKGLVFAVTVLSFIFTVTLRVSGRWTERASSSFLDGFESQGQMKRSFYDPWIISPGRRYHYLRLSDAGYGTRIIAASRLVRALIAHQYIFGMFGPGKKK